MALQNTQFSDCSADRIAYQKFPSDRMERMKDSFDPVAARLRFGE